MWQFASVVALALIIGVLGAMPFFTYVRWSAPALARIPARFGAYLVAAVPPLLALAALAAFAAGGLEVFAPYTGRVLVLLLGLASLWAPIVRFAVWVTGGPASRGVDDALLHAQADAAADSLRRGDLDAAMRELRVIASEPQVQSHRLGRVAAEVAEELGKRPPTLSELVRIRRRLARAIDARWASPAAVRGAAVLGMVISFALGGLPIIQPAYAVYRACIEAELHLLGAVVPATEAHLPIHEAIDDPPEPGSVEWSAVSLDLGAAADSRHDPSTRDQLVESGFVTGYQRIFVAADGRGIQTDAFEFESHEGAVRYQETVTRYACHFANLAFGDPSGGIGLQVRYSTGYPIVEQISWVAGTRRHLVSISLLGPPADHDRIIEIASKYR